MKKESGSIQVTVTWGDGGLSTQSPSPHLSAGRGFYTEGEWKQNKEIKGKEVEKFSTYKPAQSIDLRIDQVMV